MLAVDQRPPIFNIITVIGVVFAFLIVGCIVVVGAFGICLPVSEKYEGAGGLR